VESRLQKRLSKLKMFYISEKDRKIEFKMSNVSSSSSSRVKLVPEQGVQFDVRFLL